MPVRLGPAATTMSILWRRRGLRLRQMGHAIFFAVARDTEVEIWIAQLGRAADRAFVQRLGFTARIRLIPPTPRRDFLAMPGFVNHFRSEKDEIVSESGHE